MKKNCYFFLLLPLIYAFSCEKNKNISPIEKPQIEDTVSQIIKDEIIILHTNDMHGSIANFARLAFVVDSIEKLHENVYLFSAGDMFSGNPIVDMHDDKGMPMVDLMNLVGYDLATLGNHEFDYGQDILNKRIAQAQFPIICANVKTETGSLVSLESYYQFVTKKNTKISVLGLLENFSNNYIPATHPLKVQGLVFDNPFSTALKYNFLTPQSNISIALSHLGYEADQILANQSTQFQFIIGGHSHTKLSNFTVLNSTSIAQAGSNLKYLGEIKVKLENGKITEKSYHLIYLSSNGGKNETIAEKVAQYNDNPKFQEVIGTAQESFGGKEELGCFFTDGLTHRPEVEIAFQNDGGIRIGSIAQGDISMMQVFQLDPFGNGLLSLEMTTAEIRSLISNSFYNGEPGIRVSGIHYTVVITSGQISNIKLQHYDGSFLDENKTYKVGLSDYIYNSYTFDHQNEPISLGITTAESIIEFLKDVKMVNYKGEKRIFVENN